MSCCGKSRGPLLPRASASPSPLLARRTEPARAATSSPAASPAAPSHAIRYEYVGATGMTVMGPVTGQRYRFERPGCRVQVDVRDAASMATVPHLRRV